MKQRPQKNASIVRLLTIETYGLPLLMLPSMPLAERLRFPTCAALYFVLNSHSTILYIGQTRNLLLRWVSRFDRHHFEQQGASRVAWLVMEDEAARLKLEKECIQYFAPCCNGPRTPPGRRRRSYVTVRVDLPPALYEWALRQMEGFRGTVRYLLHKEQVYGYEPHLPQPVNVHDMKPYYVAIHAFQKEWCDNHPEGISHLVRRLLREEYERQKNKGS